MITDKEIKRFFFIQIFQSKHAIHKGANGDYGRFQNNYEMAKLCDVGVTCMLQNVVTLLYNFQPFTMSAKTAAVAVTAFTTDKKKESYESLEFTGDVFFAISLCTD